jgi:hypothetical protein
MGLLGEGNDLVGGGVVDVVDDEDGERFFFGDELEAGVLRGEDDQLRELSLRSS